MKLGIHKVSNSDQKKMVANSRFRLFPLFWLNLSFFVHFQTKNVFLPISPQRSAAMNVPYFRYRNFIWNIMSLLGKFWIGQNLALLGPNLVIFGHFFLQKWCFSPISSKPLLIILILLYKLYLGSSTWKTWFLCWENSRLAKIGPY